jgi:hypothetical protein
MESPEITMITSPSEMRALASWYRERAEATENPVIWENRSGPRRNGKSRRLSAAVGAS